MRTLQNTILAAIILSSFALGASTLTRGHEWGDDFASYIMQGQSIMDGTTDEFIVRNTFTIFESDFQIGPVAYPWGYPLILTSALAFKGVHPLVLKLPGLFLFIGFLLCLYFLTKDRLSPTERQILVSLFAFNPILIRFLDQILSDIPLLFFTFLTSLCILIFENKQNIWGNVLIGIFLFFAFFVRTTGIILLASLLAYQGITFYFEKENRKNIFVKSVQILFFFGLLWGITLLIFPDGQGSYLEQVKGLTPVILRNNILNYYFAIGSFFGNGSVWTYFYNMLIIFFLVGIWSRRNSDLFLIIFFFAYFIAMIFWPEWQGIRFAFPLLPIFGYFAFQGMRAVINKLLGMSQQIGRGLFFILWFIVIINFLISSGTHAYNNLKNGRKINGPFDVYSGDVFNFVKEETPPDSVIVFFKPRAMRLFTDRDSIMILECDHLLKGDFFVQHKNWEYSQILPDDIQKCDVPLENVFENQRFVVYKILHGN